MRSRTASLWLAIGLAAVSCTRTPRDQSSARPAPTAVVQALPDSARFAAELNAFMRADSASPPPPAPVLFVGSSSIRFWESLASDFPGLPVLNRGFGGSRMDDVLRYADRVVFRYRPRAIVLYEGDNDLQDGVTPARVAGEVAEFLSRVRTTLPRARVVCLAVKPSPSRWNLADKVRQTNALLQAVIAQDTLATYVDVYTPMIGADGRPRPELFRDDSLHMTPAGYAIWREAVAPALAGPR